MSDMQLWAAEGGLIGLVVFALFSALASFLVVIQRKDKKHTEFISKILEDEREERHVNREAHQNTFENLSQALRDLTLEIGGINNKDRDK
jgi:uncharacterized membrane protein